MAAYTGDKESVCRIFFTSKKMATRKVTLGDKKFCRNIKMIRTSNCS